MLFAEDLLIAGTCFSVLVLKNNSLQAHWIS